MTPLDNLSRQNFTQSANNRIEEFKGTASDARAALQKVATLVTHDGIPREGYLKIAYKGDQLSLGTRWLGWNNKSVDRATDIVRSLVSKAYGDRPGVTQALEAYLAESGGRVGTRSILKMLHTLDKEAAPEVEEGQLGSRMDATTLKNSNKIFELQSRLGTLTARADGIESSNYNPPTDNSRLFVLQNMIVLRTECVSIQTDLNTDQQKELNSLIGSIDSNLDERLNAFAPHLSRQTAALAEATATGALREDAATQAIDEQTSTLGHLISSIHSNPETRGIAVNFLAGTTGNRLAMDLHQQVASGNAVFAGELSDRLAELRQQYLNAAPADPALKQLADTFPAAAYTRIRELLDGCQKVANASPKVFALAMVDAQAEIDALLAEHIAVQHGLVENEGDQYVAPDDRIIGKLAVMSRAVNDLGPEAARNLAGAIAGISIPLVNEAIEATMTALGELRRRNTQLGLALVNGSAALGGLVDTLGITMGSLMVLEASARSVALGLNDATVAMGANPLYERSYPNSGLSLDLGLTFPLLELGQLAAKGAPARLPYFDTLPVEASERAQILHSHQLFRALLDANMSTADAARLARSLASDTFTGLGEQGLSAAIQLAMIRQTAIRDVEQRTGQPIDGDSLRAILSDTAAADVLTLPAVVTDLDQRTAQLGDPSVAIGLTELRNDFEAVRLAETHLLSLQVARGLASRDSAVEAPQIAALDTQLAQLDLALASYKLALQNMVPDLLEAKDPDTAPLAPDHRDEMIRLFDSEHIDGTDPRRAVEEIRADIVREAIVHLRRAGATEDLDRLESELAALDLAAKAESVQGDALDALIAERNGAPSEPSAFEASFESELVLNGRMDLASQSRYSSSIADSRQGSLIQELEASFGQPILAQPISLSHALLTELNALGIHQEEDAMRLLGERAETMLYAPEDDVMAFLQDRAITSASTLQAQGLSAGANEFDLRKIRILFSNFDELIEEIFAEHPLGFNEYLAVAALMR